MVPSRGQLFGPFYGPALQPVVNHLERFSAIVSEREAKLPDGFGSWEVGRADEIAEFLHDVLERVRSGAIDEAHAVEALTAYVRDLHVGYRENVNPIAPSCCRAPAEPTTLAPATTSKTREMPLADDVTRDPPRIAETTESGRPSTGPERSAR